jgi:hypothetical protein
MSAALAEELFKKCITNNSIMIFNKHHRNFFYPPKGKSVEALLG